jgi:hypothetical protein
MKKMTLLFMLTLGAGQLYGMRDLPPDVRREIINKAIQSSTNLDDAVKAVNVACTVQGACYDTLPKFTALVASLQIKFPNEFRYEIAAKFKTPIAKEYNKLGEDFIELLNEMDRDYDAKNDASILRKATALLDKGLDPNFSFSRAKVCKSKLNKQGYAEGAPYQKTFLCRLLPAPEGSIELALRKLLISRGAIE